MNCLDPLIIAIIMDSLCPDIIKLLIEYYFGANDSLALFCTSKKFLVYRQLYSRLLLNTKKGTNFCIINGKLDALKFIYHRRNFDIHIKNEYFFRLSCQCGRINIANWLIQLGTETNSIIDIHIIDEDAFQRSCYGNHLAIAHWLIQLGIENNFPINIHADNDLSFRFSCQNDNQNMARWLIQLGIETNSPINIHACDDNAFRCSRRQGHSDIAYWLIQLGIETDSPINEKIII